MDYFCQYRPRNRGFGTRNRGEKSRTLLTDKPSHRLEMSPKIRGHTFCLPTKKPGFFGNLAKFAKWSKLNPAWRGLEIQSRLEYRKILLRCRHSCGICHVLRLYFIRVHLIHSFQGFKVIQNKIEFTLRTLLQTCSVNTTCCFEPTCTAHTGVPSTCGK